MGRSKQYNRERDLHIKLRCIPDVLCEEQEELLAYYCTTPTPPSLTHSLLQQIPICTPFESLALRYNIFCYQVHVLILIVTLHNPHQSIVTLTCPNQSYANQTIFHLTIITLITYSVKLRSLHIEDTWRLCFPLQCKQRLAHDTHNTSRPTTLVSHSINFTPAATIPIVHKQSQLLIGQVR